MQDRNRMTGVNPAQRIRNPAEAAVTIILPMTTIILLASVVGLFVTIEGALSLQVRGSIGLFLAVTALCKQY